MATALEILHPGDQPVSILLESETNTNQSARAKAQEFASPLASRRQKPELLAPAGDRACMIAAIENGADAIYFGLERHNARIRASNFDGAQLPELMDLLHRRGVAVT